MEKLVREGALDAVLDITTTEVCDFVVGGNMSAGPGRLRAAAEKGIPYVLSLGACDMVNFGPRETVPAKFNDRKLLVHNSMVTLMRTSEEECEQVGSWIGRQLKEFVKDAAMVQVWQPSKGLSMLDTGKGPFVEPKADEILWDSLGFSMHGSGIARYSSPLDINDEKFAFALADALLRLIKQKQSD
jgi:uncharacterized protein (UPF0261 family)